MKVTLLALTLLGVMLMMGGGHGQSRGGTCERKLKSGLERWKSLSPTVRVVAERFMKKGGIPWLMNKIQNGMRHCVCAKVAGDTATDEDICNCVADMEICDMQHKPNSTTPVDAIQGKVIDLMNCLEQNKLVAAMQCREMIMTNPVEMICMARRVECSSEDEDDGIL